LIGNLNKEIFYERIKILSDKNYSDNGDAALTKKQMVDIVVDMFNEVNKPVEEKKINSIFLDTKFGQICLN